MKKIDYIKIPKFKSNVLGIYFLIPLAKENASKISLLSKILKSGSKIYPSKISISKKCEEMYGSDFDILSIKKGDYQILYFCIEFLKEEYINEDLVKEATEFLNEIIFNPLIENKKFKEKIFENEKNDLKKYLKSKKDDKREYATEKCIETMCKNEPFSVSAEGDISVLEGINNKDVYDIYKDVVNLNPNIFFAGETTEKKLEYINKVFEERFKNKNFILKNEYSKFTQFKSKIEYEDIMQTKFVLGCKTSLKNCGKEYFALVLLNEILGGNQNSLLFRELREKNGFCYYVSSTLYRYKMLIIINAGIDIKNSEKTLETINKFIDKLKNEYVKEDTIREAKEIIKRKILQISDDLSSYIDFYVSEKLLGSEYTINEYIKNVDRITKDDIKIAAETLCIDTLFLLAQKNERKE